MVHTLNAAKEAWRVLDGAGMLVNIYPYSPLTPVEVLAGETRITAGLIDGTNRPNRSTERIRMAQSAMAVLVHDGLFTLEAETDVTTYLYWDTLAEADRYHGTVSSQTMPRAVKQRAAEIIASSDGPTRVSTRRILFVGGYRKVEP